MGLLDHLISWRKAMPDQPDAITRLRAANYAHEDLPETIAFPQRSGDEPREPLPVVEASVDEIAFAIVDAERESSAAPRPSTQANASAATPSAQRAAGDPSSDRQPSAHRGSDAERGLDLRRSPVGDGALSHGL